VPLYGTQVGSEGAVIGVDMTDEQLEVARAHTAKFDAALGWQPKLSFVKGYIEYLTGTLRLRIGDRRTCFPNCIARWHAICEGHF